MSQIAASVYVVAQALYTVGYGDIPTSNNINEKIFTTILMLVGSFSFAMTIAVMSSVIANQDILYMEFRQKMEVLSTYMSHRGLPEEVRWDGIFLLYMYLYANTHTRTFARRSPLPPPQLNTKLKNHYDYLLNVQYGKLELQILGELPSSLRNEVLMQSEHLVRSHPFISSSNDAFLSEEIVKILVPRTYSPNEVVIIENSPVSDIFFIRFGKVNILATESTTQKGGAAAAVSR